MFPCCSFSWRVPIIPEVNGGRLAFTVSENGYVLCEGGVCASRLPLETGVIWAVITSCVGKRCAQTRQLFTAEKKLSTDHASVMIIQRRFETIYFNDLLFAFQRGQHAPR